MATYDLKVALTDGSTIDAGSFDVPNGKDGVGISTVKIEYGYSASTGDLPTSWDSTCGNPSKHEGEIIWVRMTLTLSDGTSQTAYIYLVNGKNGTDGSGKDGVGVSNVALSEV